jgi:hypothetical protein
MKVSLSQLQHAFGRLAPRERLLVGVAATIFSLVVTVATIHAVQSAKARLRARIEAKEHQLERVQALRAEYLELKRRAEELTAKNADQSASWLYANLEVLGVTLPQIVALLYGIEHSSKPMHVTQLQVKKRVSDPYQFDVQLSVSSVKVASS